MRSSDKSLLRLGTKSMAVVISLAIIMCATLGGTVAWLFDKSEPVINTFTYGDIDIQLNETKADWSEDPTDNYYSMYVRNKAGIFKDPAVKVLADSEKCWLFAKLKESDSFGDFLTYQVRTGEDGWTLYKNISDTETVYYRIVDKANIDQEFKLIENDRVYIKNGVTQDQLNNMADEDVPILTIYAYAVQHSQIEDVDDAWATISN